MRLLGLLLTFSTPAFIFLWLTEAVMQGELTTTFTSLVLGQQSIHSHLADLQGKLNAFGLIWLLQSCLQRTEETQKIKYKRCCDVASKWISWGSCRLLACCPHPVFSPREKTLRLRGRCGEQLFKHHQRESSSCILQFKMDRLSRRTRSDASTTAAPHAVLLNK